ncbi:rRNA maturation RNase YbeY [Capnocytophaga canis]|uniref:Endoribonuclease YbeY n=1 Tax=Capnocytophaga canis TaxID=1848903 RepID=A0A3A1YM50_9FLAO|nr:rRNA maturation RNase YbeY [Capnocytophaga canis]RIY38050.1 rRNA maturation RNase YbeY [Capnocytophaga canis]
MISFFSETKFKLPYKKNDLKSWVKMICNTENHKIGDINYIFCNDEQLHKINVEYLNHDTLTDIITFDYTEDFQIAGDIYISVERVRDNANDFEVSFKEELLRVMAHGILHLCGYKDKSESESQQMRQKEEEKIRLFTEKE